MGFIDKLLGGSVTKVIESGADIAERWFPGDEKKHEMAMEIDEAIAGGVAAARLYAPTTGTTTWVDSIANSLNRLVRPVTTFGFLGGLFGFWDLPQTGDVDPMVLYWIGGIFTFWFGMRTLVKDVPDLVKLMKEARR